MQQLPNQNARNVHVRTTYERMRSFKLTCLFSATQRFITSKLSCLATVTSYELTVMYVSTITT